MATLIFRGVAAYLVQASSRETPHGALRLLTRATACANIFGGIELVKKLLSRLLALRVHSSSLFVVLHVRLPWPHARLALGVVILCMRGLLVSYGVNANVLTACIAEVAAAMNCMSCGQGIAQGKMP